MHNWYKRSLNDIYFYYYSAKSAGRIGLPKESNIEFSAGGVAINFPHARPNTGRQLPDGLAMGAFKYKLY